MSAPTSAPTVASLCASLGHHLAPVTGAPPPDREISAVHISELDDPTVYLSGGELLLTTGLALPVDEPGCQVYVARLVEARVSALGLGLGPVHAEVPAPLARACAAVGLPLLVVPAPTPFLTISRAYWGAVSRSAEQQLNDVVSAHRALVDAAAGPDPELAVLRCLARVLDGWAALLDAAGAVRHTAPTSYAGRLDALRDDVARLEGAGVRSSASFGADGHAVVVFPLAVEDRVVGYLAAASPERLDPAQRRVVVTAAALLSLAALREQRVDPARDTTRRCVALLLDMGLVDAARRLAAATRTPAPGQVSVLAVRGASSAVADAVERSSPDALGVTDGAAAWFLLPAGHGDAAEVAERLRAADPSVAAVLTDLVAVEHAGAARARAEHLLASVPPGTVLLPPAPAAGRVSASIDRFAARAGAELVEALVGYLRHRGQWEQAARALDLHRNTLRHRVARARELLGLDLDDADVAAETWLALRARGIA